MSKVEVTLRLTVGQSVSMSWYRAPLWDLPPDITSCRNVAVWNLRSCFCGVLSLTRGRVCNLQCNHPMVRVAQVTTLYCLIWDSTQLGGPGSRIYIAKEQGGPVIRPGTGLNIYVYTNKRLNTADSDWQTTGPTSRQRGLPTKTLQWPSNSNNHLVMRTRRRSTPRDADRLTVSRNVTLTLYRDWVETAFWRQLTREE
jgi:hypothetical protein